MISLTFFCPASESFVRIRASVVPNARHSARPRLLWESCSNVRCVAYRSTSVAVPRCSRARAYMLDWMMQRWHCAISLCLGRLTMRGRIVLVAWPCCVSVAARQLVQRVTCLTGLAALLESIRRNHSPPAACRRGFFSQVLALRFKVVFGFSVPACLLLFEFASIRGILAVELLPRQVRQQLRFCSKLLME